MIVLGEKQDDVNVLHVIIGPETEFQFNLAGQSVIDISEYIANYKDGDKCVIVVNKCDCEEELIQQLNFHKAKHQAMNMMSEFAKQMNSGTKPEEYQKQDDKNKKKIASILPCPKCGAPNSAVIVDNVAYPCATCQKIDQGLQKGLIPPVPSKDALNKIKESVKNENPTQKKTMFKFYKNNSDDKKGKK